MNLRGTLNKENKYMYKKIYMQSQRTPQRIKGNMNAIATNRVMAEEGLGEYN